MGTHLREFNSQQWEFLGAMKTLGETLSLDLINTLCPLTPSELVNLLNRTEELGWIKDVGNGCYSLNKTLPPYASNNLKKVNTTQRITELVDEIYQKKLTNSIEPQKMIGLFAKAGHQRGAAAVEWELSNKALAAGDFVGCANCLESLLNRLYDSSLDIDSTAFYVSGTLKMSNLCFALGRGLKEIEKHLNKAQEVAVDLKDKRSQALINLHLARVFYFSDRRNQAFVALSMGIEEVKELGDEDILCQAAEFMGLYYFMQGRFQEALEHLERGQHSSITSEINVVDNPTVPIFLPYSAAYMGRFHQSFGCLESNLRLAEDRQNKAMTATLKAILGSILLFVNRKQEAINALNSSEMDYQETNNALARFLCMGGQSLYNFMEGRTDEAYDILKRSYHLAQLSGIVRQYSSPFIIEMLLKFHQLGLPPIPGFGIDQVMERIWSGFNTHLRGVALRLRAEEKLLNEAELKEIQTDLAASEAALERSGDFIQLSKTRLEIIRLNLHQRNTEKACSLAQRVWNELGDHAENIFPEELRYLLETDKSSRQVTNSHDEFFKQYLEMTSTLFPVDGQQALINRAIHITAGLLKSERGALFSFRGKTSRINPELEAAVNLSSKDIKSEDFRSSLNMIKKSFKTNRPLIFRPTRSKERSSGQHIRAAVCIPIELMGKVRAILYHDNSHLDGILDTLDTSLIEKIGRHLTTLTGRILEHQHIRKERDFLARESIPQDELIAQCRAMKDLLEQVDRVAGLESTVLITGETGTGKELLSKRIKRMSGRSDGPFIVVDCTSIPKNLIESELFGHEKGAFTGADRQKVGRIEMAHKGTLFLDEVGELPLSSQPKLLRALQEKTFIRLGGSRNIKSDFRLITATNRNLGQEVAAGRFREDLFYRLNVVPLHMPPLRERRKDVILLANHFLKKISKQYGQPQVWLSPEDEDILLNYDWPGNVRELQNVIERAVILSRGDRLELNLTTKSTLSSDHPFSGNPTLDDVQREYIKHVLEQTGGRISGRRGAAEILGMKRTSLYNRMKRLGVR